MLSLAARGKQFPWFHITKNITHPYAYEEKFESATEASLVIPQNQNLMQDYAVI